MTDFHVFLSHNSKDKAAVVDLGEALKARGLKPWLDIWDLPPGKPWQEELEEIIETIPAAAVIVGADGMGPWQEREMRAALSEFVNRKAPVIPVLLPSAPGKPDLPIFLRQFTWVDLRGGLSDENLDRLVWGITGRRPNEIEKVLPAKEIRPPKIHNLPFLSLGQLFKGRDTLLEAVTRDLETVSTAAVIQAQALHGLGGIGKTRLVVEYAWRSGRRYWGAFFVKAETSEAFRSGLAGLGKPNLLKLDIDGRDEEWAFSAVLEALRKRPGWLLIIDNVDTEAAAEVVRATLPRLVDGHILVTSRLSRWRGISTREVDKLEIGDAIRYLLERTAGQRRATHHDEEDASQLAKLVDGLPIALEQAAAYISFRGVEIARYLDDWQDERHKVLGWYRQGELDYPVPVAVTWQKSFQQLGLESRALLRLLSHLATDPIPVAMIESGVELLAESVELLADEAGVVPAASADPLLALAELVAFSLIDRREDDCTVHRMVQEVVRGRIFESQQIKWTSHAVRFVNDFAPNPPDDARTWPVWDRLRSHVMRVIKLAEREGITQPTSTLMSRLATWLDSKSLYSQAEPLKRRVLEIDERIFGVDHPNIARDLNNLAQLLKATNRLADAEPLMRRALEIDKNIFGKGHPSVARDLSNLAQLLQDMNRLAEAEPLMRQALEIDVRSFGSEHPKVAIDLNNLAQLLQDTNRLAEAEPLMRQALEIDERFFGTQHPDIAIDLNNLAQLLQDTNRLAEAEPLMRRALEIDKKFSGTEHPNVAIDLNNLAALLKATGRLAEAEPLMRQALEIDRSFFGMNHPSVAIDLNNLAQLLKATDRLAEAEPLMRRALETFTDSLGDEHPDTRWAKKNLESLLHKIAHAD